jgi:hypothetical protein
MALRVFQIRKQNLRLTHVIRTLTLLGARLAGARVARNCGGSGQSFNPRGNLLAVGEL